MVDDKPTKQDVLRLLGDISDHKVVEILETGADLRDLEAAAAWLEGESDVMGEVRSPLVGASARVYDILSRDEQARQDQDDQGRA